MMSDAISRKWIKNAMLNYGFTAPDMTVTELIEDAPEIEPRHGKWEVAGDTTHYYICSICGKPGDWHDNYCPQCGAKMEEE